MLVCWEDPNIHLFLTESITLIAGVLMMVMHVLQPTWIKKKNNPKGHKAEIAQRAVLSFV